MSAVRLAAQSLLDVLKHGNVNTVFGAADNLRAALEAATAPPVAQAQDDITQIYELFGIGSQARSIQTLMVSLRNTMHFADLLHAVEREFFMVPGEPDDEYPGNEPTHDCILNCWGSNVDQYIEQFRAALTASGHSAAPAPSDLTDEQKAAPELLAALEEMTTEYLLLLKEAMAPQHHKFAEDCATMRQARSAISKATGSQA